MAIAVTNIPRLERELHTEIYPGTEIMTDVGTHHFVKSSSHPDRVLVPQPSDDPHDPLNWSRLRKLVVISIATAVSFSQGLGPLALAPMFPQLMESFDADLAAVVKFTGVCILVLGFSNFFWIPIQTTFGRRPVLIFSTLICVVSNVWRATAKSYGSYMGACVLNGFGAGPAETSQPEIIADILFLHERGAYNTLYFTAYFGSLMVGPIIAGPMAEHVGWRNFFWFNTALLALVLILVVFFFPETKWQRTPPSEISAVDTPPPVDTNDSLEKPTLSTIHNENADPEIQSTTNSNDNNAPTTAAPTSQIVGHGTPCKRQFALYQLSPNGDNIRTLLTAFYIPWKLHLFPIIELSAFVVSWSASVFLTLNLTQSQAFAAPPYNFSSQTIGFFNFAILVGALIGLLTNGPLSDWISMRATLRNRGVREPEMRLPTMIPYLVVCIVGNFVVAFGYEYKWDWRIIVLIGYTAAGIQVAALPAIVSTYAVDSYKPVAGSIFVTITVNKNLWGYGFSEFITKWIEASGFVKPIMMNMSLTVLWCLCAVPFYVWGKRVRKWTAKSDVHDM
ncbi:major facilitator superfamily domain-containing protein [Aspergillus pseudoustus]|uniref:Major facilitator superfamily domain-containing protein n=1 Tax=Aspergillus pseudoustus TaxID=1810923 RepID=A0ABR4L2B4_9EURO